ncbi:unnamed protein product [Caenorhabditis sp. 36 PRJEB53466]|nr:unnamed protein product [Caenorhabditis sp. 36 PRJEB53466]
MSVFLTVPVDDFVTDRATLFVAIVQLGYGLPSFALMLFFLFFLGHAKAYTNSFYRLVQMDLLINVLYYINSFLSGRIVRYPSGLNVITGIELFIPGLLTLSTYLVNFFMHLQFCTAFALSAHRISAIYFYSQHDYKWSRWYPFVGLLFVLYAISTNLSLPGTKASVFMANGTLMASVDVEDFNRSTQMKTFYSFVYFTILLVLWLFTSVCVPRKFRDLIKTRGSLSASVRKMTEKLTKIALTYCLLYTGFLIWSVFTTFTTLLNLLPNVLNDNHWALLIYSTDLMTLALPYILIAFDNNVKNDLGLLRKGNEASNEPNDNAFGYLNTWLSARLIRYPDGININVFLERTIPGLMSWPAYLTNFFTHMQFCSACALNIHRITAIVYYDKNEQTWSRWYPLFFLVSFFYSFLPGFSLHGEMVRVELINATLMSTINVEHVNSGIYRKSVYSIVYFLILIALLASTYWLVYRTSTTSNRAIQKVAKKLTRVALVYCVLYTGIIAWTVITVLNTRFAVVSTELLDNHWALLMFVSDSVFLSLPYILLCFDSNVRKHLIRRKSCVISASS